MTVCALALFFVAPAAAQSQDTRELMQRLDRLQRELTTLQQDYYRNRPAASPQGAAPPGAAAATSSTAAAFEVRLSQIESQLQALTGRIEELSHASDLVKDRLDKLVADIDMRLAAQEQRQPGAPPQQAAPPPPASVPPATASRQPEQPGPGAPPAPLGALPQEQAGLIRPPLPDGPPKAQYDYATALITKEQNFPEAERALKAFIAAHPTDGLTPNAYYWLGETFYVRKDFQQAAFTFAEAFQKYPKAQKAPDSLFKLGMALAQLNQTKEACTAYGRLLDNFPTADNALKARVNNEQRRLKCV